MEAQHAAWFVDKGPFQGGDEGSMGEGLAHFLKVQLRIAKGLPDDPCPFIIDWLNSQRKYYINIAPDDHNTFEVFSCTTLFIFYLHDQLGFSVESIIAAGVGASNFGCGRFGTSTPRHEATNASGPFPAALSDRMRNVS